MNPIEAFESTSLVQATLVFFLRPNAYLKIASLYDAGYALASDQDLHRKWKEGSYDPGSGAHDATVSTRAEMIRSGFWNAGTLVAGSILASLVVRITLRGWPEASPSIPIALQVAGAAILLWATVWQIAWGVRSFGGETLSERVHTFTVRVMAATGTFLFVLAYVW